MAQSVQCSNPGCGAISQADDTFCFKCGTKLEQRCSNPQCRAVVHAGENSCRKCGTPLAPTSSGHGEQPDGSGHPANDLERDILANALSGGKTGVDNKLLANNIYTVPVDAYIKPNTTEVGIKLSIGTAKNQETYIYIYTSPSMFFDKLLFSDRIKLFAGDYYQKTGQFLMIQVPLKEIMKKVEEIGAVGLNVNTGCNKYEFYLSKEAAKVVLAYSDT